MKIKAEFVGAKELKKALERANKGMAKSFVAASKRAAESLLRETEPLVPYETGALLASGAYVQDGKGWATETIVGYGFSLAGRPGPILKRRGSEKFPEEYAVVQHEEYENKKTPGTTIEYLKLSLDYNFEYISDIFYTYMQSGIK